MVLRASRAANRCNPLAHLATLLPDYPDIKVEVIIDFGVTDIVAERYDAGIRIGEQVAKGARHDAGTAFILQSVALAADLHDGGVVQDAAEHGGGEHGIAGKGLVPASSLLAN